MTKNTSTSPEAVMSWRRVAAQEVKTVNRNLFFYMKFKFYTFDRHIVYASANSLGNSDTPTSTSSTIPGQRSILTSDYQEQQRQNRVLETPRSTVILPLPTELVEEYSAEFAQAGIGLINRTLLDSYINGRVNLEELMAGIGRTGTQIRGALIAALPDGLQSAAEQGFGKIVNPVYNSVFRGVPIRSHNFSWKIAPESPEEQADIEGVLNALRKHSIPAFERSGEINNIMYPDFCKIELTPSVFKFPKPMFVTALAINHAPEGVPAFFHDGKPVGYEIKMRLTEASALVRQDIVEDEEEQQTT